MKYPLTALLAVLQQAEYNLRVFHHWVQTDRSEAEIAHVRLAQPERWTSKLRLIRTWSQWLVPFLGAERAVSVSTWKVQLLQWMAAKWKLWRAAQRLRTLQSQGLTIIAVAGSYGKTSVKHALFHLLSARHATLMTPESVNTPLGIAAVISQLTVRHSVFIVELGEQQAGDLKQLMALVRPDIVVVTPVGFAHLEHFGSEKHLLDAFTEITESPYRPALYLVDDQNRNYFQPKGEAIWYGTQKDSAYRIEKVKTQTDGTSGHLVTPEKNSSVHTPLPGAHQLVNFLPGIIMLALDGHTELATTALEYAPAIPRRLELHRNPNGTVVIDNSYNTNPGAWLESKRLLESLSLGKVVVITAGFVELDQETANTEHQKLAHDLTAVASGTVILHTLSNQILRQTLSEYAQKHSTFRYAEAYSLDEALTLITNEHWMLDALWLEGGCRELYQ